MNWVLLAIVGVIDSLVQAKHEEAMERLANEKELMHLSFLGKTSRMLSRPRDEAVAAERPASPKERTREQMDRDMVEYTLRH